MARAAVCAARCFCLIDSASVARGADNRRGAPAATLGTTATSASRWRDEGQGFLHISRVAPAAAPGLQWVSWAPNRPVGPAPAMTTLGLGRLNIRGFLSRVSFSRMQAACWCGRGSTARWSSRAHVSNPRRRAARGVHAIHHSAGNGWRPVTGAVLSPCLQSVSRERAPPSTAKVDHPLGAQCRKDAPWRIET